MLTPDKESLVSQVAGNRAVINTSSTPEHERVLKALGFDKIGTDLFDLYLTT